MIFFFDRVTKLEGWRMTVNVAFLDFLSKTNKISHDFITDKKYVDRSGEMLVISLKCSVSSQLVEGTYFTADD